jgi:hypothetical protein
VSERPAPVPGQTPVTSYAVVARPEHVEAMARAVASPRWFGPLPWFTVVAGTWVGLAVGREQIPEWLRVRPALGWPVVLACGALAGALAVVLSVWVIRRTMRRTLVERGWGAGTEHVVEHGDGWVRLSGPGSDVLVDTADVRRVHERGGAVVLLMDDGAPVLSVSELFQPSDVERLRRAARG